MSVCALNDDGVCIGCWRDVDEIAGWRGMGDDERREVLRRAHQRALAAQPCRLD
jgi:predicted Fe-S protein YdhL (DUF1289 family)